jgi:hypothetical protein
MNVTKTNEKMYRVNINNPNNPIISVKATSQKEAVKKAREYVGEIVYDNIKKEMVEVKKEVKEIKKKETVVVEKPVEVKKKITRRSRKSKI